MNAWRKSEPLPDAVVRQLIAVPSSNYCGMSFWPCQAVLRDGRTLPRVIFRRSENFYEDSHLFLSPSNVAEVSESPYRLPAMWANVVYAQGETGMDFFMFRVFFRDQTHIDVTIGSTIDFIPYPEGKAAADVTRVAPWKSLRQPFNHTQIRPPEFFWCVFSN